ncbi:LytR/AlgR family response regulator transcription factor [Longitalea luteola]|uniref:LytR/AlgR family response regulator transcription factor n=1 Tax=Longitalea luteola TaxID=2812563 RepID=UPI001A95830C|nr:LytTR family DNA-binding domain-containing protein [Longitalea luteola]
MQINTVIIEDEAHCLYVLNDFIAKLAPDLTVTGTASHVGNAVQLIEDRKPDLVFMDVRLGDGTGFDVLRKLTNRQFELVFITAYDNYAMDAFKFSAVDYLLKPLGMNEFEETMERVRTRMQERKWQQTVDVLLHNLAQKNRQLKKINIATLNGFDFVELNNIIWCKSDNTYTTFFLADGTKILSSRNLGHYEEMLIQNHFCRIHHSVIVNLQLIKTYVKGKGGSVIMVDGTELEVSQRRKNDFLSKLMM